MGADKISIHQPRIADNIGRHNGAQGGNRTHTPNREADFKSVLRNIDTTQYQAKSTIQWQPMGHAVWQVKH
jgi:hypothetical protein